MQPMNRTTLPLHRCAALAGLLLATAGTSAAAAAAPTLTVQNGTLTYSADPVADLRDDVRFDAAFIGGDSVLDVHHNLPLTLAASARSRCSPEGTVIRCMTSALTTVSADGGPGDDRIAMSPDFAGGPRLALIARGGDGADELLGGSGRDVLAGDGGDDVIRGRDYPDSISGGEGADRLDGGSGSDVAEGGAGDDALTGDPGSDKLDGGDGHDRADYSARSENLGIVLSPQAEFAAGGPLDDVDGAGPALARDALISIEEALGGSGDDQLMGAFIPVTLRGGPGDDLLHGANHADTLFGDDGADTLAGAGAVDALWGGDGDDLLRAEDATAESAIDCGGGIDRLVHDADDATTGCETLELFGPQPPTEPVAPPVEPPRPPVAPPREPVRAVRTPKLAIVIEARFAPSKRATAVTRLRLRAIPAGTTVVLTCRAPNRRACPTRRVRKHYPSGARRIDLLPVLRGRPLPPRTTLELRLTNPGTTGLLRRFMIRRAKTPARTALCLPAGTSAAAPCNHE